MLHIAGSYKLNTLDTTYCFDKCIGRGLVNSKKEIIVSNSYYLNLGLDSGLASFNPSLSFLSRCTYLASLNFFSYSGQFSVHVLTAVLKSIGLVFYKHSSV